MLDTFLGAGSSHQWASSHLCGAFFANPNDFFYQQAAINIPESQALPIVTCR
jgi:hypothetical protein